MSVYKAKVMMDPLERQARETERLRQRKAVRRDRLLHEKTRIIGIDAQALEQQTLEKQRRFLAEAERDSYYDELANGVARQMVQAENIKQQQARAYARETAAYNESHVERLKRQQAISDSVKDDYLNEDTRFLHFHGEDLDAAARRARQHAQQKRWLGAQISDTMAQETRKRQEEAEFEFYQQKVLEARAQMEAEAAAQAAAATRATADYNAKLGVERQAALRRSRARDAELARLEVEQNLASDVLNEKDNGMREDFKGFSKTQRLAILEVQRGQIEELRQTRRREEARDAAYNQSAEQARRELLIQERAALRAARAKSVAVRKTQEVQHRDKTMRYDYLDNVVYTNPVQESFFEQFGQSDR